MNLEFDNLFTQELPCDNVDENYVRQVNDAVFSRLDTAKAPSPTIVSYSKEVGALIGLSSKDLESDETTVKSSAIKSNLATCDKLKSNELFPTPELDEKRIASPAKEIADE